MRRTSFVLVLWVVSIAASGSAPAPRVWNFDRDKVGVIALGFRNEAGEWHVVADDTAPSKPNVLAQVAKSAGEAFNVTLVADTHYTDLDLSVKMRAVAGNSDQGGGLVWRARDAKNYYIARFNPLEQNFRVYKVVGGARTQFQSAVVRRADGWHTLRVTMKGAHIECFYDAKRFLTVDDTTFSDGGMIGLWSKADAQSHFDDLTVTAL